MCLDQASFDRSVLLLEGMFHLVHHIMLHSHSCDKKNERLEKILIFAYLDIIRRIQY